jgi:hypothetical protein
MLNIEPHKYNENTVAVRPILISVKDKNQETITT